MNKEDEKLLEYFIQDVVDITYYNDLMRVVSRIEEVEDCGVEVTIHTTRVTIKFWRTDEMLVHVSRTYNRRGDLNAYEVQKTMLVNALLQFIKLYNDNGWTW